MSTKKINLILFSIILFSLPVSAYVITEETTSPEYLINNGYSPLTADHVQLEKARSRNQEYKTARTLKKTWWRKVWEYIDFGTDDGTLLQHDINPGYTYKDW